MYDPGGCNILLICVVIYNAVPSLPQHRYHGNNRFFP